MKKVHIAAALYAAVGIFSFGYAADWRWDYNDEAVCLTGEKMNIEIGCSGKTPPVMAGLFAAVLWPLYWSWELQS